MCIIHIQNGGILELSKNIFLKPASDLLKKITFMLITSRW